MGERCRKIKISKVEQFFTTIRGNGWDICIEIKEWTDAIRKKTRCQFFCLLFRDVSRRHLAEKWAIIKNGLTYITNDIVLSTHDVGISQLDLDMAKGR